MPNQSAQIALNRVTGVPELSLAGLCLCPIGVKNPIPCVLLNAGGHENENWFLESKEGASVRKFPHPQNPHRHGGGSDGKRTVGKCRLRSEGKISAGFGQRENYNL